MRRGEPSDREAVAAIQAASPDAAQWDPATYWHYHWRVAVQAERVAGFLVARTLGAGESEILNLAVAVQFRRQGVARALLRSWMREFGGDVFLEVRASNKAARNLYKSLGFQELNERPQYYTSPVESAIVMKFHSC